MFIFCFILIPTLMNKSMHRSFHLYIYNIHIFTPIFPCFRVYFGLDFISYSFLHFSSSLYNIVHAFAWSYNKSNRWTLKKYI